MNDQVVSYALGLLIPTLWIAFLWRYFRLIEIDAGGRPVKRWRWILIGLLVPVYAIYMVITFGKTPLLIKISIALVELIALSVWIYYCDQKIGK